MKEQVKWFPGKTTRQTETSGRKGWQILLLLHSWDSQPTSLQISWKTQYSISQLPLQLARGDYETQFCLMRSKEKAAGWLLRFSSLVKEERHIKRAPFSPSSFLPAWDAVLWKHGVCSYDSPLTPIRGNIADTLRVLVIYCCVSNYLKINTLL